MQLAEVSGAHRILHIHRNQPGVLAELNRELAAAGLNILGQHLKTDERTGYVITDVDRDYDPEVPARPEGCCRNAALPDAALKRFPDGILRARETRRTLLPTVAS